MSTDLRRYEIYFAGYYYLTYLLYGINLTTVRYAGHGIIDVKYLKVADS